MGLFLSSGCGDPMNKNLVAGCQLFGTSSVSGREHRRRHARNRRIQMKKYGYVRRELM